jgi:hypothetical protein
VWQPIDASELTYGTNGFHLPFSDNSTAAALGTDTSGNGNDWTVNNISVLQGNGNYTTNATGTFVADRGAIKALTAPPQVHRRWVAYRMPWRVTEVL